MAFDKVRALRDLEDSGEAGGRITRLIRPEQACVYVGPWMREHLSRVKAGEISIGVETDLRVL